MWLDDLIGVFSPMSGLKRKQARIALDVMQRGYEGAKTGRRIDDWLTTGASANKEIASAGNRLRERARDLVRNNPYGSKAVEVFVGISPRSSPACWTKCRQQPYTDEQINKALVLAGVESTLKPLAKTRTMKGAQITASAGAVAAVSGVIAEAAPAIPVLSALSQMVKDNALGFLIALGVLVVFSAAYIAWARIDDRRKGLV